MDTKTLRGFVPAAAFLVSLGITFPALATLTGVQTLGPAVSAIDVWTFTCPTGTVSARATVQDFTPFNRPAFVQVVLGKVTLGSAQATDTAPPSLNGEGGAASAEAQVSGGAGLYAAAFKKTAIGGEGYIGDMWCVNAAGTRTNPTIFQQINQ